MFKEDYKKEMAAVRAASRESFQVLANAYNTGQISKKEFSFYKDKIIIEGNERRSEIIKRREYDISRQEEFLLNKIIGTDRESDLQRYRQLYSDYSKMADNKDALIGEYEVSLKLDDSLAGKAAAAVAAESNIKEILDDYSARDESFVEAVSNYQGFCQKWRAADRKFSEYQCGEYGFIREPISKKEVYQSGTVVNESGQQLPHYRERVKYE